MTAHAPLYLAGALTLAIGLLHIAYPWIFRWTRDFQSLPRLQVKLLYTLHVALLLLIIGIGLVTLLHAEALLEPGLGRTLLWGFTGIWAWRLVWQLTYWNFTPRERARRHVLGMHWAFTAAFVVILAAYGWTLASTY